MHKPINLPLALLAVVLSLAGTATFMTAEAISSCRWSPGGCPDPEPEPEPEPPELLDIVPIFVTQTAAVDTVVAYCGNQMVGDPMPINRQGIGLAYQLILARSDCDETGVRAQLMKGSEVVFVTSPQMPNLVNSNRYDQVVFDWVPMRIPPTRGADSIAVFCDTRMQGYKIPLRDTGQPELYSAFVVRNECADSGIRAVLYLGDRVVFQTEPQAPDFEDERGPFVYLADE